MVHHAQFCSLESIGKEEMQLHRKESKSMGNLRAIRSTENDISSTPCVTPCDTKKYYPTRKTCRYISPHRLGISDLMHFLIYRYCGDLSTQSTCHSVTWRFDRTKNSKPRKLNHRISEWCNTQPFWGQRVERDSMSRSCR